MSPGPKLLLRALSGSVIQLQLESVLLSVTVSTQRAIGTISDEIRGHTETALLLAGTGKTGPASLDAGARELVWTLRGELALHLGDTSPPLSTGNGELILMAWEKTASTPSPEIADPRGPV